MLWGIETIGLSPSQLRRARTEQAACSGVLQSRRCSTTAIYLAFGSDVAQDVVCRCITTWHSFVNMFGISADLRVAWRHLASSLTREGGSIILGPSHWPPLYPQC